MQLGAFHAGTAIELSMLGATHACANPVTARYGTTHGHAIAILLPHVVRWNASVSAPLYAELLRSSPRTHRTHRTPTHPSHLVPTLSPCGFLSWPLPAICRGPCREAGASSGDLAALASEAAGQWTGTFNPRPFDADGALEIYQCAF